VIRKLVHDIVYLCAKFDDCSLSRFRDIIDVQFAYPKFKWFTYTYSDHVPFNGRFVIRGLSLVTTNLSTDFEISISTHYEDMKGDVKCRKRVVLGSYGP